MSYWLRGDDTGGLGVFNPPARPVWIDPGMPASPAIVALNTRNNDAYQIAMVQAQAQDVLDQCHQNAQNASSPAQYAEAMARCSGAYSDAGAYASETAATPVAWYGGGGDATPFSGANMPAPAAATGVSARGGHLTFTTSRGGQALQVGDTWLIAITGATPNAPVTVSGSMPSGSFSGTSMGSTDGSGNFSKSGTAGAGDIGAWQESWAVGGAPSGGFSFSITAASAPGVTFAAGGTPAGSAPAGGTAASSSSTVIGGFDLSAIPWWGWLAAGGAALFAFGGARGR